MCSNLTRSFLNKYLLNVINSNAQQKRLKSFKAAIFREPNKPFEIKQLDEIKKIDKNDVRVQVNFCSLNKNDLVHFQVNNSKNNFIPGYELSGEVLEVGSDVKPEQITVGERVAVLSKNRGGLAEQCIVNSSDVWRLPSNIKRKDAAVIIFGHTNAMYAFSHFTTIKEDTKIIITAGPAGLGLAAIDVAANIYKAKPVGICESEELSALVRERGAFKTSTINNKNLTKDFANTDLIYDAIGGDNNKLVTGCIKPGGKILYAGPFSKTIPTPPPNCWLSVVNIEGLRDTNPSFYRSVISDTLDLLDEGMISAHVSAVFELEDINKAVKYIQEAKCTGKVLIKVDD